MKEENKTGCLIVKASEVRAGDFISYQGRMREVESIVAGEPPICRFVYHWDDYLTATSTNLYKHIQYKILRWDG